MISEGMNPENQTFFEMEEDHERLCGVEGRLLKEKGNRLVQCSSDDECLPPSQCHTTGYCCMIALNQEPPPVGCPIGTRPLVNSSGMELTCSPSVPDSCPGGALCYTDSLTNAKRCCGTDPGQGCPSGSRVLLTSLEKPMLCIPGKADALCPRGALCQWSHLIDRYQCCEPDNGCPRHQAPLKTVDGASLLCNPRGAPCPDGAGCHFNFWTASYQCCKMDTVDLCPAGQVPILADSNGEPKSCRQSMDCPTSYHCAENNICCGSPGTCPENQQPAKDKFGRLTACTARNGNTCPTGSKCFPTGFFSQHLCCEQIEYTCPGYSTPYPSSRFPQKCDLAEPWRCGDKQCMPSFSCQPSKRNSWLCCSVGLARAQFTCPFAGQEPVLTQQGGNHFCSRPGTQVDCPQNAVCVSAGDSNETNICCRPAAAETIPECPNGGIRQPSPAGYKSCSINSLNDCDPGYSCVRASNDFSIQLCCSASTSAAEPVCPNQGFLLKERGRPVYCSADQPHLCPTNYPCESAVGAPGTYVCCSPSTISCPTRYLPFLDPNGNKIMCSLSNVNDCPVGSTCTQSMQSPTVHLCCKDDSGPPLCPSKRRAFISAYGTVETCSEPGLPCSQAEYTCQFSDPLGQYICCSHDRVPAYCANGHKIYEQIAGETYTCNPRQVPSSCPVGYECSPSTLPETSVCCATTTTVPPLPPITLPPPTAITQCPPGWEPYRNDLDNKERSCTGQTDTTNQPNQCPRGYTCEQSIIPSISLCCSGVARPERLLCTDGKSPSLLNGFIRSCPVEGQTEGCPNGDTCQRSTTGMLVCCSSSSSSADVCPQNRCNSSSECGRGFFCNESNVSGVRVCCSSGTMSADDASPLASKVSVAKIDEDEWVVVEG
ncbi:unnamed protein product [Haemonchus placei]|uniref:Thyroglobulin n=1 Tax=Haemonchus placei TaxID=6290 RepID=A0A158QRC7_HAEPC|nr:unnamed protein product [Haemonchus placei]